jgi:hypothetical protein
MSGVLAVAMVNNNKREQEPNSIEKLNIIRRKTLSESQSSVG